MHPVRLGGPLFAVVGFGSSTQAPVTKALCFTFDHRLAAKPSLTFKIRRACVFDGHINYATSTIVTKQPSAATSALDQVA